MKKMTSLQLIRGIYLIKQELIIQGFPNTEVTAIQFEDGGGKKFNYQLDGQKEWHFVDLTAEMP